ncbi:MAG: AAA family ATPase [Peptostreptococcaceae bacterium]
MYKFKWVEFYEELASYIQDCNFIVNKENYREQFLYDIKEIIMLSDEINKTNFYDEYNFRNMKQIDPFLIFNIISNQKNDKQRFILCSLISKKFNIKSIIPRSFVGIPLFNKDEILDVDTWEFFKEVFIYLEYKDSYYLDYLNFDEISNRLFKYFNDLSKNLGILTKYISCISPNKFIILDNESIEVVIYLNELFEIEENCSMDIDVKEYLIMCNKLCDKLDFNISELKYKIESNIVGRNNLDYDEIKKWIYPISNIIKNSNEEITDSKLRKYLIDSEIDNISYAKEYFIKNNFIDKDFNIKCDLDELKYDISDAKFNKYYNFIEKREMNKDLEISYAYFLGTKVNKRDMFDTFIKEGRWENGYSKQNELVNEILVGDKIALKSTFNKKTKVLFDSNEELVSTMRIKAVGTVIKNHLDGNLDVLWEDFDEDRDWYFFTSQLGVWKVEDNTKDNQSIRNYFFKNLLDFTFKFKLQDYDKFLNHLHWNKMYGNRSLINNSLEFIVSKYSDKDFLKEVYMDKREHDTLKNILLRKKNIILSGSPGVGKTYLAKRLAYSILGKKDIEKVKSVQFHQSYSYEDFIMGYRPSKDAFEIKNGVFYEFCMEAINNKDENYFFIIDEINRGNLSKIFGELFMLIESDKRSEEYKMKLIYSDEEFYIPKNVHIIGMMNTADRSLSIIDYALRRRFAFFNINPAFEKESFINYMKKVNKDKFDKLINEIVKLNIEIEEDLNLGKNFKIGHSYFVYDVNNIDENWLNDVLNYEIIPILEEYWFDEMEKVYEWSERLKEAIL